MEFGLTIKRIASQMPPTTIPPVAIKVAIAPKVVRQPANCDFFTDGCFLTRAGVMDDAPTRLPVGFLIIWMALTGGGVGRESLVIGHWLLVISH
jgi:hypothetical protein